MTISMRGLGFDVHVVSKLIRAVTTMFKEAGASDSETAHAHSPVVVRSIPNEELTEADIPVEISDWSTWSGIPSFAASFNGYTYWGSFKKCFEVGLDGRDLRDLTLTELRTVLFCLYRSIAHDDWNFTDADLVRAKAIITEIRERVRQRAVE